MHSALRRPIRRRRPTRPWRGRDVAFKQLDGLASPTCCSPASWIAFPKLKLRVRTPNARSWSLTTPSGPTPSCSSLHLSHSRNHPPEPRRRTTDGRIFGVFTRTTMFCTRCRGLDDNIVREPTTRTHDTHWPNSHEYVEKIWPVRREFATTICCCAWNAIKILEARPGSDPCSGLPHLPC